MSDAIQNFKQDVSARVLLMNLRVHPSSFFRMTPQLGANGLNLVEATDVILVEPLLNGGVEAQAISRVYRIGITNGGGALTSRQDKRGRRPSIASL